MLNYLWGGMLLIGLIVGVLTGRLQEVTSAVIDSSKEAVMLCITMLGIMSMWTGIMKIAEKGGLIDLLCKKLTPLLRFLFPDLPQDSLAIKYIATNFIANILGLGWAATPAGLKAIEQLQHFNKQKDTASKSMCMFMIINMSSLQLVTINILAYRSEYNSQNSSEIIGPGLLATVISTIIGIVVCKVCEKGYDY